MFKKIIIFLILVIVLVVAFELFLDVVHYNTEILFQYQPEFGWSHMADKDFWYEGNLFSINKDGFRDIDHEKEKPEGVTRIAFVSSHYLRGTNSCFENLATTILKREWNRKNDKKIEVFNFAIPKYNLEMAHFLIKEKLVEYDIDYFIYLFDPQKDPMTVAGNSDIINYAPALVFDERGAIQENLNFTKPPFASERYKAFKTYQFLREIYKKIKELEKNGEAIERDVFEPYPEIYFDAVSSSTFEIIEKMAGIMDYIIENNQTKVYILILPPQHSQFFEYYERYGNLNYFDTDEFVKFIEIIHHKSFEEFMKEIMFFVKKVEGNHFDSNNLIVKLRGFMRNPDKLIELNEEFLKFSDAPASDGFLHNWHRRDEGQEFLAELLEMNVLPLIVNY